MRLKLLNHPLINYTKQNGKCAPEDEYREISPPKRRAEEIDIFRNLGIACLVCVFCFI